MTKHKLKLWILRNRNDIVLIITTTALLTILILQGIVLSATYEQSKRNEDVLKGLSCILLIPPSERTSENVRECIKRNTNNQNNFMFKTLEHIRETGEVVSTDSTTKLILDQIKGEKGDTGNPGQSVKGDKGDTGATGAPGATTMPTNGKDGKDGATGPQGEQGEPGRATELRYNESKDRIEWRYVGDTSWKVLVKACELTNTCS